MQISSLSRPAYRTFAARKRFSKSRMMYGTNAQSCLGRLWAESPVNESTRGTGADLRGQTRINNARPGDSPDLAESASHKRPLKSDQTAKREIRVMSYNILAESLAKTHRQELYRSVPQWCLDWPQRERAIVQEIAAVQPDVVTLQEVDHHEALARRLAGLGFEGLHVARERAESGDGCSTFWRSSRLQLVEHEEIQFSDYELRHNVALLTAFQLRPPADAHRPRTEPSPFVVGNTHVLFNPQRGDIKLGQVRVLLEHLHLFSRAGELPAVICGDFNATPDSALYRFITESQLDCLSTARKRVSGQLMGMASSPLTPNTPPSSSARSPAAPSPSSPSPSTSTLHSDPAPSNVSTRLQAAVSHTAVTPDDAKAPRVDGAIVELMSGQHSTTYHVPRHSQSPSSSGCPSPQLSTLLSRPPHTPDHAGPPRANGGVVEIVAGQQPTTYHSPPVQHSPSHSPLQPPQPASAFPTTPPTPDHAGHPRVDGGIVEIVSGGHSVLYHVPPQPRTSRLRSAGPSLQEVTHRLGDISIAQQAPATPGSSSSTPASNQWSSSQPRSHTGKRHMSSPARGPGDGWNEASLKLALGEESAARGETSMCHSFTLKSAYHAVACSEAAWTTCHDKFCGTVDYMWYTAPQSAAGAARARGLVPLRVLLPPPLHTPNPSILSPRSPSAYKPCAPPPLLPPDHPHHKSCPHKKSDSDRRPKRGPPGGAWDNVEVARLPCAHFPSDHIALVCDFELA